MAAAGAKAGALGLMEAEGIAVLLSSVRDGETLIHVLVDADAGPADRLAAARAAEGLRRRAEDLQKKGAAQ